MGEALELEGKANTLSGLIKQNLPAAMQGLVVVPIFAGYDRRRGVGRAEIEDLLRGRRLHGRLVLGVVCGHIGLQQVYDPDRVKTPMKRTNPNKGRDEDPQFVPITWEEALDLVATRLGAIRDEHGPSALAGFGSSELIGLSKDEAGACLNEVFEAVHAEGGVTGIHVCANTDWSMVMESQADIVNFDAYGYFDRFILYEDQIVDFFRSDRVLAWGLVPTLNPEDLLREDAESLATRFFDQVDRVAALGIETAAVLSQSLITPSCGAGSLTLDLAEKVLTLTRDISKIIRKEVDLW